MKTSVSVPRHPCGSEHSTKQVVLLVEDEPFVREATCRILQSAGFVVLAAGDAEEALTLNQQSSEPLDLLMSDLVLPGRNGRQLAEDVQRRWPAVPVLLTSGYLEVSCDHDAPEARTYFLQKPYSKSELVEKLAMILRHAPKRAAARQVG